MLAAVQGVVKGNAVYSQDADLLKYDGRIVTIILNEPVESGQVNRSFLETLENDSLVVPTGIDADKYVKELRENDRL